MSDENQKKTGHRSQETGHREQEMKKGADISARLIKIAAASLQISERLPRHAAGRHVALQLVRCGTGGGSNYEEARAAESAADFAHKALVAAKEVRETLYWLCVLKDAGWFTTDVAALLSEVNQMAAILAASARTARRRAPP